MPGSSSAFDPDGNEIVFEESRHKYYSPAVNGRPQVDYVSGTSLIHRYCNSFEKKKNLIASKVAGKRGISVEDVIAEWDRNRDEACAFGTRVHETCEDVLLGRTTFRNEPKSDKEKRTFDQAKAMAEKIKSRVDVVAVEKIIFDIDLKIAGTADLLVRNRETGGLVILDWKTNQSIDMVNSYGDKMDGVLSQMDDCNFNVYSLQLSLYEYLMRKRGFVPDIPMKKAIVHVTETEGRMVQCADYGMQVRDVIIDWLSKKSC